MNSSAEVANSTHQVSFNSQESNVSGLEVSMDDVIMSDESDVIMVDEVSVSGAVQDTFAFNFIIDTL